MAFLNKYFGGDYSAFRNYFNGDTGDTLFKIVLNKIKRTTENYFDFSLENRFLEQFNGTDDFGVRGANKLKFDCLAIQSGSNFLQFNWDRDNSDMLVVEVYLSYPNLTIKAYAKGLDNSGIKNVYNYELSDASPFSIEINKTTGLIGDVFVNDNLLSVISNESVEYGDITPYIYIGGVYNDISDLVHESTGVVVYNVNWSDNHTYSGINETGRQWTDTTGSFHLRCIDDDLNRSDIPEFKLETKSVEDFLLLKQNPAGITDIGITYQRSKTYHSILRNYVLPLRFNKSDIGGGNYLKGIFEEKGIYSEVDIEIYEFNANTEDYDKLYFGVCDFKPKKYKEDKNFIQVGIEDGSKEKRFVENESKELDVGSQVSLNNLPVYNFTSNPRDVLFGKVDIIARLNAEFKFNFGIIFTSILAAGNEQIQPKDEFFDTKYKQNIKFTEFEINELQESFVGSTSQFLYKFYQNNTGLDSEFKFTETDFERLTGTLIYDQGTTQLEGTFAVRRYFRVIVLDEEDAEFNEIILSDETKTYYGLFSDFTEEWPLNPVNIVDNVYQVPKNGKIAIEIVFQPVRASGAWSATGSRITYSVSEMVNYFNFQELTGRGGDVEAKCWYPHELMFRSLQIMTGEQDLSKVLSDSEIIGKTNTELQSYTEDGDAANDTITNGGIIRHIPDYKLNISFNDLFTSYANMYGLGFGYDREAEFFYVKEIEYFYNRNVLMADLGEVSEMVIEPYDDAYNNDIQAGYVKVEYEELKGINAVNTKAQYSLNVPVKGKFNFNVPFNADCLTIALSARTQFSDTGTTDTRYDDKVCIARTDGNDKLTQGKQGAVGFTGIETWYNLDITPRQNLIRIGNRILPGLDKSDEDIKFLGRQKNISISYQEGGELINENDDIKQSEIKKTRLFDPLIARFKAPINNAILQKLDSRENGFFIWSYFGVVYAGFAIKANTVKYPKSGQWEMVLAQIDTGANRVFENKDNAVFEKDNNAIFE